MTEELKPLPCPWCGSPGELYVREIHDGTYPPENAIWTVSCDNEDCPCIECKVTGYTTEAAAIKAWNTRSPAWRDIESAPRDWDHPIMVFGNWYDYPVLVKSCGKKDWGQVDEDGNFILGDDDEPHIVPKPSFWQLPLPPEESNE